MKIKGVVFDVDGLLVDTEGYQYKGWVEVLRPMGLTITKQEYFLYAGKTGTIIENELIERYKLKVSKGYLLRAKEKLLAKWFEKEKLKPMPYAKYAVQFFVDRGFLVGACTGSSEAETIIKLKKARLVKFPFVIISGNDVKRGKPYPDGYLAAASKLGLKPEECLAFEDTQYGLQSAKDAGLICLAVPSEFSLKQDFSMADGIFRSLKEAVRYAEKYLKQ